MNEGSKFAKKSPQNASFMLNKYKKHYSYWYDDFDIIVHLFDQGNNCFAKEDSLGVNHCLLKKKSIYAGFSIILLQTLNKN